MISQWPRIKQRLCNYRFRTYFSRSSCGWMGMLKLIMVVNKRAVPPNRSIVSNFGRPPLECTLRLIDLIITSLSGGDIAHTHRKRYVHTAQLWLILHKQKHILLNSLSLSLARSGTTYCTSIDNEPLCAHTIISWAPLHVRCARMCCWVQLFAKLPGGRWPIENRLHAFSLFFQLLFLFFVFSEFDVFSCGHSSAYKLHTLEHTSRP